MARYTGYMNQLIADTRQPYAAHIAPPQMPDDPINQLFLPVIDGARLRDVDNQTQNALLMTMLALRTYRLEHSTYPPSLAALTPGYLKAVPDDPFAISGPLRYQRTGNAYVLYSVGPDSKDDGGNPIFDPSRTPSPGSSSDPRYYVLPESKGDIVAGINIF